MIKFWKNILSAKERYIVLILGTALILLNSLEIYSLYFLSNFLIIISNNFKIINSSSLDLQILKELMSQENYFLTLTLILISLFVIKNFLFILFNKFKYEKISDITLKRCADLYSKYYHADYIFHLNFKTSLAIRNLQNEEQIGNFLNRLIDFAKDISLIILILFFILLNNYIFFLTVVAISLLIFLLHRLFTKSFFYNTGKNINLSRVKTIQAIEQTFSSFKDIFNLNKYKFFFYYFDQSYSQLIKNKYKGINIQSLPKLFLETISIIVLCSLSLIAYTSIDDNNNKEFFSGIVFLGLAFYKCTPSINSSLTFAGEYQMFKNIFKYIYKENLILKKYVKNKKKIINQFNEKIILHKIYYKYPSIGKLKNNLENVNLKILKGEIVGIFGKTGSGKSSLISIISGLLKPQKGKIMVDNKKIKNNHILSFVAIVPQKITLLNTSILKNITLEENDNKVDKKLFLKVLKTTGVSEILRRKKIKINSTVSDTAKNFSGGEIQRLAMARALYSRPKLLILDETFSGLDTITESRIFKNLNNFDKNLTIIIVSHNKQIIQKCNKIYELKNKKINTFNKQNFSKIKHFLKSRLHRFSN